MIDATEKWRTLRALTDVHGGLHEEQVRVLQSYGLGCSAAVKAVEIQWSTKKQKLTYFLTVDPGATEDDFARRIGLLRQWSSGIMRGWTVSVTLRVPKERAGGVHGGRGPAGEGQEVHGR